MYDLQTMVWRNIIEAAQYTLREGRPLMLSQAELRFLPALFNKGLLSCTGEKNRISGRYSEFHRIPIPHFIWVDGGYCGFSKKGNEFIRFHSLDSTQQTVRDLTSRNRVNSAYSLEDLPDILSLVMNGKNLDSLGVSIDAPFHFSQPGQRQRFYDPDTGIFRMALWLLDKDFSHYVTSLSEEAE